MQQENQPTLLLTAQKNDPNAHTGYTNLDFINYRQANQ